MQYNQQYAGGVTPSYNYSVPQQYQAPQAPQSYQAPMYQPQPNVNPHYQQQAYATPQYFQQPNVSPNYQPPHYEEAPQEHVLQATVESLEAAIQQLTLEVDENAAAILAKEEELQLARENEKLKKDELEAKQQELEVANKKLISASMPGKKPVTEQVRIFYNGQWFNTTKFVMQFESGTESLGLNITNHPMMRGKFRLDGIIEFTLAAAYKDVVAVLQTNKLAIERIVKYRANQPTGKVIVAHSLGELVGKIKKARAQGYTLQFELYMEPNF